MSYTKIAQVSDEPLARGSILRELITEVAKEVIEEECNSTLNVKGNRKVVRATYYPPDSVFRIPDGIDLEDKTVVENWWVRYDQLHIEYVDGREGDVIESEWQMEIDTKHPDELEIIDADDGCVEYEEDSL